MLGFHSSTDKIHVQPFHTPPKPQEFQRNSCPHLSASQLCFHPRLQSISAIFSQVSAFQQVKHLHMIQLFPCRMPSQRFKLCLIPHHPKYTQRHLVGMVRRYFQHKAPTSHKPIGWYSFWINQILKAGSNLCIQNPSPASPKKSKVLSIDRSYTVFIHCPSLHNSYILVNQNS